MPISFAPMRYCAAAGLVMGTLAACAVGTQFMRPPEGVVRLGETTRAQLEARLGAPDREQRYRQDTLQARLVDYTYSNDSETAKMANSLCIRSLSFVLVEDVVFAELFTSSCASDHTDFDDRRAGDIVKGTTRCDDVIAMLGRPAYRAIHPVAKEKGNIDIGYRFLYPKRPLLQLNMYEKALGIVCDADGVVKEVSLTEAGDR
jgi:hypothetical protein